MEKHIENLDDLVEELDSVRDGMDNILHLNYKGLEEVPEQIFDENVYKNVRRIYMKQNRLKTLPEDIGQMHNLVELYLHSNDITSLPEGLGKLQNLESLDLSHNNLNSLPACIGNLQNLERLLVSNNNIQVVPKEIGQLKKLQVLDLMSNRIKFLPSEISSCSSLVRLLVDRNHLAWLPRQLSEMRELEEVSAASNRLLYLPLDLGEMKSLKSVYVDNNPYLHAVPLSIDHQEIGFSSCGSANFPDSYGTDFMKVIIQPSDNQEKVIYLPQEIQVLGDRQNSSVPSLLELSMRAAYLFYKQAICPDDLPRNIYNTLKKPITKCPYCLAPIFTMGYPMVFDGQLRLYSLYKLCVCCSPRCVKLASLLVNLPLIYPSATEQNMAVVLVEQPVAAVAD